MEPNSPPHKDKTAQVEVSIYEMWVLIVVATEMLHFKPLGLCIY